MPHSIKSFIKKRKFFMRKSIGRLFMVVLILGGMSRLDFLCADSCTDPVYPCDPSQACNETTGVCGACSDSNPCYKNGICKDGTCWPPGTYGDTCTNCKITRAASEVGTMTCDCYKISTISRCGVGLCPYVNNGDLACGICPPS